MTIKGREYVQYQVICYHINGKQIDRSGKSGEKWWQVHLKFNSKKNKILCLNNRYLEITGEKIVFVCVRQKMLSLAEAEEK